ncbi:nucleotidyltransferase-like protein [Kineococcus xinjiangensis]|uniref:Nucleotidyltransferase-like protein n=1 Tax=Kineococcus xinjiangensis TaxID=512762 RepID=A0A2S6IW64_9ACTN|nr:nucleotidyltransferase domain-containing protein [Kineococcus xinjiangensis]PPK98588.1 nucleotidyltransferase-like protein [Kineococcus xinjiangensis]
MDPVLAARAVVDHRYPEAVAAVLAGSSARGEATPTSDLDIVVVLNGSGGSFRETLLHQGQVVEVFAYTGDEVRRWWDIDATAGRCTLAHMCAHGLLLHGEQTGQRMQHDARVFLAAGPPPVSGEELLLRRYRLTGAVDDLRDATDPGERQVIAAAVLLEAAELHLITQRQWRGQGKWLLRRLRAAAPALAERLLQAHHHVTSTGDAQPMVDAVEGVLLDSGGRLAEGYRRG